MPSLKTVVMVPKGAEYGAVCKGLARSRSSVRPLTERQATKFPEVVSLPVGPEPVRHFLRQWSQQSTMQASTPELHVIVMGLCGSLVSDLTVGDVVLYERCLNGETDLHEQSERTPWVCSTDIPLASNQVRELSVRSVTGVMCDRILSTVAQKRQIGGQYQAQVVDMEGIAVFQSVGEQAKKFSMVRVVSDDSSHDLPDLSAAFDPTGQIRPLSIAGQFLLQPAGAARLIRGSLIGLQALTKVAEGLATGLVQS
ncbi:MAG: hypothetical protein AAGB01_04150 [Cyanobacteria bacterium P01_F01_bin.42]